MNPTIQRKIISDGVFGEMQDEKGQHVCMTMEHIFDGKPKIPSGTWEFVRYFSPHFERDVFMCDTIPGHTKIELHVANFVEELEGCVALGTQIATRAVKKGNMLTESQKAFDAFMARQEGIDKIQITFHD